MILKNSAMCGDCWQEIVSRHKHDYITCSCGQLSIDGGSSYLKRNSNHYVDTSLSSEDDFDKIRNEFEWGARGVDGKQQLEYIKLKNMEATHIESILATQFWLAKEIKDIFKKELDIKTKINGE